MEFTTPQGFRDVLADEAIERERLARSVQDCFAKRGYVPIETPTLESMDVMQAGGRVPSSPFKFFDAQGSLVTMRPDVTLQVARMCATRLGDAQGVYRFRYMQRVFREIEGSSNAGARERKQIGIECIGLSGIEADAEVICLFAEAMKVVGVYDYKLSVATVSVLRSVLEASGASSSWKSDVLDAFHASNLVEIDQLCDQAEKDGLDVADTIRSLARIRGGAEAIGAVRDLARPYGCDGALDEFEGMYGLLVERGLGDQVVIDFSVMSSFDYYTGFVFEAYAPGLGTPLGSGGRYDNMLGMYGSDRPAAGFAFYLEQIQEALSMQDRLGPSEERPLRIAVPKGSLYPDSIAVLESAGLDVTGLDNPGRSLIVSNPGVDYIIVRPSDAPIFVEMGAADCGICGEDSLIESSADVVELVDLRFGACRFIVAELEGAHEQNAEHYRRLGSMRVATKYPNIARDYFARIGTQVEIV
ncbi:MAG: ATP phosphoribosyltransferase, partial [Eggerthellaceae bacterium]|nr:ATP phosphoribosyltransferase [Eggerthellaceae bacterium]